MVIHIKEGKESKVFGKFIIKHPFLDLSGREQITMRTNNIRREERD